MIYDGIHGYLSGDLNVPVDTVLAVTKGPITGRNWFNFDIDPTYSISITAAAGGAVALQGTNDVALQDGDAPGVSIQKDILPTEAATWTDIQASTSTSATGTFNTSYEYLRLIVTTQGTGFVTQAWVKWN